MGKLCRFPMHYDEELDMDIHQLIHETPTKRRSARLRQLIRLGLAAEQGGGKDLERTIEVKSEPEPVEARGVQHRNRLRFTPPTD